MARYRKIDTRLWGDSKFRRLSPSGASGKHLWIFLLTGPHTTSLPGLFRAGEMAMAEELGWPLPGFRKAFTELFCEGLAKADWNARVVWIPNAIKYNPPENPNVVKGWRVPWDEVPECPLKIEAYQRLASFTKGLGEGFGKAFLKSCANGTPNQEPEQEKEQDLEQEQGAESSISKNWHNFVRPNLVEVAAYCLKRGNNVDPQQWYDHYEANGWRVGRNSMKDWRAAVRNWEKNGVGSNNDHRKTSITEIIEREQLLVRAQAN